MKTILEINNISQTEHNNLLLESFFFWAGKYTYTRTQMQIVVTDKAIKKWFFKEYEKLEFEYLHFVKRHSNASAKDNERLYARMVGKIYEIYPKVLLDEILNKYDQITDRCLN